MSNPRHCAQLPPRQSPSSNKQQDVFDSESARKKAAPSVHDKMQNITKKIEVMRIQPSQSGISQRKASTDSRTFQNKSYSDGSDDNIFEYQDSRGYHKNMIPSNIRDDYSEDDNRDQDEYDDQDEYSENEHRGDESENTDQDRYEGPDYSEKEHQDQDEPNIYQQQALAKVNFPAKNDHRSRFVYNSSYSTKYKPGQYEEEKNAEEDKLEDDYQDKDFRHTHESIVGKNASQQIKDKYKIYNWEPQPKNYKVFLDEIEPDDILQGGLGDCYLLAVLSKLAERPHRVKKLFITKQETARGTYEIQLCKKGEWVNIELDKFFPFKTIIQANGRPIKTSFTHTNGNESWVLILEKGWVKLHHFYLAIIGGNPVEAMRAVTGAPASNFVLSEISRDELWKKMIEAQNLGYLMTCCIHSRTEKEDSKLKEKGIVAEHAYTILQVIKIDEGKFIKIRNPWGKRNPEGIGEWEGAFSDKDKELTAELKKKLNHESKDDGRFCMKYSDFHQWFDSVQIGYVHDDYELDIIKESSKKDEIRYFIMNIQTAQELYVMINQDSKRSNPGVKDFKYSKVSLKVSKITPNGLKNLGELVEAANEQVWTKNTFTPGDYCVEVKINWNGLTKNEFTLNTYGPSTGLIKKSTILEVARYLKSYH